MLGPKQRESYSPISLGKCSNMSFSEMEKLKSIDAELAKHYSLNAEKGSYEVDTQEWLQWREHGPHWYQPAEADPYYLELAFGGSSIASIFDVSPWTTSLELYHRKIGVKPVIPQTTNITQKLGHIYESSIAQAFQLWMSVHFPQYNVRLVNDTRMFRDGRKKEDGTFLYPWATANTDFTIYLDNQPGIMEIKRTSPKNYAIINQWKKGIVPIYYMLQCIHYMAVLNVQYYVIVCAWGMTLEEMTVIFLERDYDVEESVFQGVSSFAHLIQTKQLPNVQNCLGKPIVDYYHRYFGSPIEESSEKPLSLDSSLEPVLKELNDITNEVKEKEERKQKLYATLYPHFENHSYGYLQTMDGRYKVTVKPSKTRESIDMERLQKDNLELFEQYSTIFDAKRFKSEQPPGLVEQYVIPPQIKETEPVKWSVRFEP